MAEGKNEVLMLTRDHLYLYDGGAVLSLDFPPSVIKDLDVKDRDGLFNLITNFIQSNKLVPAQIYFILSDSVCFIKDFSVVSTTDPEKANAMVDEYTNVIPFTNTITKVYKTPNTWRVVSINEDLVDTVFEAFGARGFGLSALTPASVFQELAMATDLTPEKAQLVLSKKALTIKSSMVGERSATDNELTTTDTAVPKNKMLPYLAGVFGVLILVLIILVVMRLKG